MMAIRGSKEINYLSTTELEPLQPVLGACRKPKYITGLDLKRPRPVMAPEPVSV